LEPRSRTKSGLMVGLGEEMDEVTYKAGNLKPDKAKSTERIDGMVALIMGIDRASRAETPKRSRWEEADAEIVRL